MVHAHETIIRGTVNRVIWVCNKWYMKQLEGWDILPLVFTPTGYDEITLDNIVCRVFVYLISMFNLEITLKLQE